MNSFLSDAEKFRQNDSMLVKVVPSPRQVKHQEMEFYAFVHFTVNSFTDKEWGDGTEDPAIFNPRKMDATQWVKAVKSAGMTGLILTCKHHDGFCLWPSKYTNHSVAASPYLEGKGDIVGEVAGACNEYGIKFGVYLSPWDRNSKLYGRGKEYDDYFVHQLEELLTNYGDVFTVWFDGACGEGPNGKKQYYDWNRYYETIRRLQPDACIAVCGPDVRWCGNEAGHTRNAEWSVVPERTRDTEKIAENSQQSDDASFRVREIHAQDADLGSRKILKNEDKCVWYPAEVNTSIRPGWFYHEREDDKVKTVEQLVYVYEHSVGGNATFLLNIPPTPEGLFHENDVKTLGMLGEYLKKEYSVNLINEPGNRADLSVDSHKPGHNIETVLTDDYNSYFMTEDGTVSCTIKICWEKAISMKHIILKENILLSQRIEQFTVETVGVDENVTKVHEGTIVGYKKIITIPKTDVTELRIHISDSRIAPTLSYIGVY